MSHAGESYTAQTEEEIRKFAEIERYSVVKSAERLRAMGHECPIVSVGSTPTALYADNYDGVTEVRAGVYMFQDLIMVGVGACGLDDISVFVLASVIGYQRDKNWIVIDGGWMALSHDRGTKKQAVDQGYGIVCCGLTGAIDEDLVVQQANQERGVIVSRSGRSLTPETFLIGQLFGICRTTPALRPRNMRHIMSLKTVTL